MTKLTVLQVKVDEEPQVVTIENELESIRSLIGGGWIETVRIAEDILIIIDEEGLLKDLPFNFATFSKGQLVHSIHGDVFFVSLLGENFASLDKEQIQQVKQMFRFNRGALVVNL